MPSLNKISTMKEDILSVVFRKRQFPRFTKPLWLTCMLSLTAMPCHAGNMIKWVDNEGRVHYSDQVPPEYAKKQKKFLNKEGRTIKTIEAAKTKQQIEEENRKAKLEAERKRKEEAQKEKDRILLLTYQSIDSIEESRDNKLTTIDNTIQITMTTLKTQQQRLDGLLHRAANFERTGRAVPGNLLQQIKTARSDIDKTNSFINSKKQEKEAIRKEFDGYIKRYRELTQSP